ncbi:hypothetical protein, partial [Proteus terrae]|uniref:hypothetical protein n=1 Tax=Proteus terrae TaxID=1574161 RepID=UPI00301BF2E2
MKRPMDQIPPLKVGPGSWAVTNEQKAEIFANHLEEIFKPNEDNESHRIEETTTINLCDNDD